MTARILIVGCGAIGGLFASALTKAAEVTAFDANADHVAAIARDGLRVKGKSLRVARFAISASVEDFGGEPFDAIPFLIKSKATASVAVPLSKYDGSMARDMHSLKIIYRSITYPKDERIIPALLTFRPAQVIGNPPVH